MSGTAGAPLALIGLSLGASIVIFLLGRDQASLRNMVNLAVASLKLVVVAVLLLWVETIEEQALALDLGAGLSLLLRIDRLSLLFVTLSALLWFVTTVYAIGYLKGDAEQRRFFGFFSLCVSATVGIALAGNLLTFFIFYELLTLSTLPLVAHRGNAPSLAAARRYLAYTLSGSAVFLLGVLWLQAETGVGTFSHTPPEALTAFVRTHPDKAMAIFVLMISGLAVKAAMMPVHGWLPAAMVAPAPVSALLHAVAVVKAGAFGIVRVVVDIFGLDLTAELGLGMLLTIAASLTILGGSLLALRQTEIKKRLAFSTVSQVSYIILGTSLLTPLGLTGALVHLVHQGLMKITLFFCAGILEKVMGATRIADLDGAARRLPLTMLAFSIGALGMIGLPPIAGFVSKWYLAQGALEAKRDWVLLVLVGSTLLNALYFFPLIHRAWFKDPPADRESSLGHHGPEAPLALLLPALFTAFAAVGVGVFAAAALSPLSWAELIVARDYVAP